MKGYGFSNIFSPVMIRDLDRATQLVDRLPEKDYKDRLIRCHEVVRALKGLLPSPLGTWRLQDGFYRTVNHSWLVDDDGYVLDLYSVARYPMVQLMDSDIHFHRDLFRPGPPRHDIRHKVVRDLWRLAAGSPGQVLIGGRPASRREEAVHEATRSRPVGRRSQGSGGAEAHH